VEKISPQTKLRNEKKEEQPASCGWVPYVIYEFWKIALHLQVSF
jgi:hypothetical protein